MGQPSRVFQGLSDVLWFEVRVVGQDLFRGGPMGDLADDYGDGYPHAADTCAPPHVCGSKVMRSNIAFGHLIGSWRQSTLVSAWTSPGGRPLSPIDHGRPGHGGVPPDLLEGLPARPRHAKILRHLADLDVHRDGEDLANEGRE